MARKLLLKPPPDHKPKPKTTLSSTKLTRGGPARPEKTRRLGEVAGGAAAECVAVCCCCPCTVMNLVVIMFIKFPACMYKKAKRRHRLSRTCQKKALLDPPSSCGSIEDLEKRKMERGDDNSGGSEQESVDLDLEKEMWERFSGIGFWRSPSL